MRDRQRVNFIDTGPTLSTPMRECLTLSFTTEEIRKAMWSIADNKALGLDGYNSRFDKASWSMVGPDVVTSIQNVIYKCISKLVCSKLKQVLGDIISQSQGAFVAGWNIAHNILLCQDIVKHYTRKNCSPCSLI